MPNKKIIQGIFLSLWLNAAFTMAQEAALPAGGNASGSGGSVSYSFGQVFYQASTETSGSVFEGLQQAFEIFVLTGTDETYGIHLNCMVYPNPSTSHLVLQVNDSDLEDIRYRLIEPTGKQLAAEKLSGNVCMIPMDPYAPGTYYLSVWVDNKSVKTFKIVKK